MNRSLGSLASIVVAAATAAFAISMLINDAPLSWGTSLIMSWGYVVLAGSFAAESADDRKAAAYSGLAFAVMYAGFVGVVYFVERRQRRFCRRRGSARLVRLFPARRGAFLSAF
jgi:hypothetical protein